MPRDSLQQRVCLESNIFHAESEKQAFLASGSTKQTVATPVAHPWREAWLNPLYWGAIVWFRFADGAKGGLDLESCVGLFCPVQEGITL